MAVLDNYKDASRKYTVHSPGNRSKCHLVTSYPTPPLYTLFITTSSPQIATQVVLVATILLGVFYTNCIMMYTTCNIVPICGYWVSKFLWVTLVTLGPEATRSLKSNGLRAVCSYWRQVNTIVHEAHCALYLEVSYKCTRWGHTVPHYLRYLGKFMWVTLVTLGLS